MRSPSRRLKKLLYTTIDNISRQLSQALWKRSEVIRDIYQKHLSNLAKQNGKQGASPMHPEFIEPCVTFISNPSGAKIHLVLAAAQEYYELLRKHNEPLDGWKPRSIAVADGEEVPIYGRYILYAKWSNGRSAKDMIKVRGKCTIEVMPD